VDGDMMSACITPALFVEGCSVETIEGLAPDLEHLTPLQDAFIRHGGFQCGICTPGQIMAATALLADTPRPTTDDVKRWMMGNLCRCTGYYKIVESILAAADVMAGLPDPGPMVAGTRLTSGQPSGAGGLSGPGVLPGPGARTTISLADTSPDPRPLTPNPSAERSDA
ncbi:MAG: (2Fe-2S)-binding protein, partial [Candidatus Rokuibacteriota bacterium]